MMPPLIQTATDPTATIHPIKEKNHKCMRQLFLMEIQYMIYRSFWCSTKLFKKIN